MSNNNSINNTNNNNNSNVRDIVDLIKNLTENTSNNQTQAQSAWLANMNSNSFSIGNRDLENKIEESSGKGQKNDNQISTQGQDTSDLKFNDSFMNGSLALLKNNIELRRFGIENLNSPPFLDENDETETKEANDNECEDLTADDFHDKKPELRAQFERDFMDKNECQRDQCTLERFVLANQSIKLSKSMQKKLASLYLVHLKSSAKNIVDDQTLEIIENIFNDPAPPLKSVVEWLTQSSRDNGKTSIMDNVRENQMAKNKLFTLLRSIVERVCIDAMCLCDQYSNQLHLQDPSNDNTKNLNNPTNKLWAEVRLRGCQFLGPQMQDDVLNHVLLALETAKVKLSRRVLVMYLVYVLKKHYPKASKTSVGHVVQLLYRAGCFKVEKRVNDSSLMNLRQEYTKYSALRRLHDTQIIQIALESSIRMTPDQWSQKLFGDANHKSEMQSIIDTLQSKQTLEKLFSDMYDKLAANNQLRLTLKIGNDDYSNANRLMYQCKEDFEYIAAVEFDKKLQPPPSSTSMKKMAYDSNNNLNSLSSGESQVSDNDTESNFDFDEFDMNSMSDAMSAQYAKPLNQVKIEWPLLKECMTRTIRILNNFIEFSIRMEPIIHPRIAGMSVASKKYSNQSNFSNSNTMRPFSSASRQTPSPSLNSYSKMNYQKSAGIISPPPGMNMKFRPSQNLNNDINDSFAASDSTSYNKLVGSHKISNGLSSLNDDSFGNYKKSYRSNQGYGYKKQNTSGFGLNSSQFNHSYSFANKTNSSFDNVIKNNNGLNRYANSNLFDSHDKMNYYDPLVGISFNSNQDNFDNPFKSLKSQQTLFDTAQLHNIDKRDL